MFKKVLVITALTVAALTVTPSVYAEDNTCVQVYGGGVVCGAQAPHQPVNAGLGENLALIGAGLVVTSGVLLFLSKKARINPSL